jgi:large subunit ribosomal protein L32e
MVINKELLEKRRKVSEHRPKFVRQESWRYDRLAENWRKPKGKDNKMRRQVSGVPPLVKVGYRGPKISRGLHPSGYLDKLVYNIHDLEKLNPKNEAGRVSRTVGKLKRKEIISRSLELDIKILNPGKPHSRIKKSPESKKQES